ncbi:L,D-transpeptidase family protein [Nitratifractor sp.]|uniref:L,D-transpeptidase family protein n=1 Tax=Nitratifractor sp. TaxID=2268144 RepID=UPI00260063A4|nr:L,D-transpeptidase family protein [Nitratifractor sp.]
MAAVDSAGESTVHIEKKPIPKAQKVLIDKSERTLYLIRNGKAYRHYHIALGKNPEGPKIKAHDRRTPEGNYTLDYKNPKSHYYRAIHVSYPGPKDRARAKKLGVDPGGAIMIHGQPNWWGWLSVIRQRFDWTAGCIAVSNGDMDEIWQAVDPGTPIEIRP